MSWNEALTIGSMAMSLWGSSQEADSIEDTANRQASEYTAAAEANAELSKYDAAVTRKSAIEVEYVTNQAVATHRRQVDQYISTQRARFSKSGVAVSKGTPIEAAEYSLDNARSDELTIRNEGRKKASSLRDLATRYDMLAEKGLREGASYAGLVMEAAEDQSDMAMFEGFSTLGQQALTAGETYGWWE